MNGLPQGGQEGKSRDLRLHDGRFFAQKSPVFAAANKWKKPLHIGDTSPLTFAKGGSKHLGNPQGSPGRPLLWGMQGGLSKFRPAKIPRRTEMRALDREIAMKAKLI